VTAVSARSRVRRHPERGVYDREAIEAILDEAVICHVGFVVDEQPFVIPTIHARVGGLLYLHGSPASRMLRTLTDGVEVCVTATLLDGVVLARSVYKSSLNYRSAVVLGRARLVDELDEKRLALEAVVEHVASGRSRDARPPSTEELQATTVLALRIDEASAKVRTGPPGDFDHDLELEIWAGVIPLRLTAGTPETEARVPAGVEVPAYASDYRRPDAEEPPGVGREGGEGEAA
jgi:nitroimidazol reductase NimA-like FMN-containing flavoprotein (pyridoxamine 5'-phosphate oxidase superfamily)